MTSIQNNTKAKRNYSAHNYLTETVVATCRLIFASRLFDDYSTTFS